MDPILIGIIAAVSLCGIGWYIGNRLASASWKEKLRDMEQEKLRYMIALKRLQDSLSIAEASNETLNNAREKINELLKTTTPVSADTINNYLSLLQKNIHSGGEGSGNKSS